MEGVNTLDATSVASIIAWKKKRVRTRIASRLSLSKDYKKDIFSILADGVELLHKRLRLLYITFNFKAADKNYLYFLF